MVNVKIEVNFGSNIGRHLDSAVFHMKSSERYTTLRSRKRLDIYKKISSECSDAMITNGNDKQACKATTVFRVEINTN